eukprot:scaffold26064_cov19-Tisochrysis_lutea.AAC.1
MSRTTRCHVAVMSHVTYMAWVTCSPSWVHVMPTRVSLVAFDQVLVGLNHSMLRPWHFKCPEV